MKKIISALTLGAMIGAAAFADVTVKLNYRQRANLYTAVSDAGKQSEKAFGWLDAYGGAATDSLAISLAGDIAKFDVTLEAKETMGSNIRAKVLMGSLFLGPVTLQAGFNADGIVTGAYRTNADLNFGNFEGVDFEFKKLGSAFGASPIYFVDNLIGHVNGNKREHFALVASYGLKSDKGTATFKAAMVTNENSEKTSVPGSAHAQGHQFSFIADGQLKDIGRAEVVFKVGERAIDQTAKSQVGGLTAMAFGLYAQPSITKNLTLTAGGAVGVINYSASDFAIDLRARYEAIPKKLSITSFHSFSCLVDGDNMKITNASDKGLANYTYTNTSGNIVSVNDSGKHSGAPMNRDKILTNNLMVRYNVNDTLTVYGIAADMVGLGKSMGEKVLTRDSKNDDAGAWVQLRFSGWAQFFATSAASINVGVVCSVDDVGNQYNTDKHLCSWYWSVPMILRIKF